MSASPSAERGSTTKQAFQPSVALLAKLGSIAVHAEEMIAPGGHPFDAEAIGALLRDREVINWLTAMRSKGLLPEKRNV